MFSVNRLGTLSVEFQKKCIVLTLCESHSIFPLEWIFPRDPDFEEKAARVLDLYQGIWQGQPLGADEYVLPLMKRPAFRPGRVCTNPTLFMKTNTKTTIRKDDNS